MRCHFCGSEDIESDETLHLSGNINTTLRETIDGIQVACRSCKAEYIICSGKVVSVYQKSIRLKPLSIINEQSLREGFSILFPEEEQ